MTSTGKRLQNKLDTFNLSPEGKVLLLSIFKPQKFKKNDFILWEGQTCKNIYFVEEGCVRSFYNQNGKDVNANFTLGGQFTTNLKSLREDKASDYSIQAMEASIVWKCDKNTLSDLYARSHEIALVGRDLIEQLLAEQEEQLSLFKITTPLTRYDYLLKNNPDLLQKVSLTHLSSYLGISRETLSRIRKKH